MALQSCLVAVAALLVCGATARPQRIAVFEELNLSFNESAQATADKPTLRMHSRADCPSGPVFAPPCSDTFPLTTLEADSVVKFVVPGTPLLLTRFAYCGWEFQGPSDGKLYITCETASFFFGQYFLVWDQSVAGVHNQQNVNIQYQFSGSSGRVGVRTLSKSFYAPISCQVSVIETVAVPATTEAAPATTEAAPATTEAAPATTEAVPGTTQAAPITTHAAPIPTQAVPTTTETAPGTTEAASVTTEAAPTTTETAPGTTEVAPRTTEIP